LAVAVINQKHVRVFGFVATDRLSFLRI